jgi:hypothetical protein
MLKHFLTPSLRSATLSTGSDWDLMDDRIEDLASSKAVRRFEISSSLVLVISWRVSEKTLPDMVMVVGVLLGC